MKINLVLKLRDQVGVPDEGLTVRESERKGVQAMQGIASDALIEQQILATTKVEELEVDITDMNAQQQMQLQLWWRLSFASAQVTKLPDQYIGLRYWRTN